MKKCKIFLMFLMISGMIVSGNIVQSVDAYEWNWKEHRRGNKHYYDRENSHRRRHFPGFYKKLVLSLSNGFMSFTLGGREYYYKQGYYYHSDRHGYYEVAAPIGACVSYLPYGHETIYRRGKKYYVYNGAYYKYLKGEYVVVYKPHSKIRKHKKRLENREDIITLNIPNDYGEYTSVIIKRSGSGFVGPQGEYYKKFPGVEQLKIIYGS